MMKELLIESFKKSTSGKNEKGGRNILKMDLISNFNVSHNIDIIKITSNVISENFFSEFSTKLNIDLETKEVISSYCTCDDYEKNEIRKNNYCCSHLYGVFYKFLDYIDNNEDIKTLLDKKSGNEVIFKSNVESSGLLSLLLGNENKEK